MIFSRGRLISQGQGGVANLRLFQQFNANICPRGLVQHSQLTEQPLDTAFLLRSRRSKKTYMYICIFYPSRKHFSLGVLSLTPHCKWSKLRKKTRHVALDCRASPSLLSKNNQDTLVDETVEKAHISHSSVRVPLHSLNIYKMHVENTFPLPTITARHLTSFSHMPAVISLTPFISVLN